MTPCERYLGLTGRPCLVEERYGRHRHYPQWRSDLGDFRAFQMLEYWWPRRRPRNPAS